MGSPEMPLDPSFCGAIESALHCEAHFRSGELKGSAVSGPEGYKSPFRAGVPKLTLVHTFIGTKL